MSFTIVAPTCVVSLAITLFEGWLQSELTFGKIESPHPKFSAGAGSVQESWVQRMVTRLVLVTSQSPRTFHSLQSGRLFSELAQFGAPLTPAPALVMFGNG